MVDPDDCQVEGEPHVSGEDGSCIRWRRLIIAAGASFRRISEGYGLAFLGDSARPRVLVPIRAEWTAGKRKVDGNYTAGHGRRRRTVALVTLGSQPVPARLPTLCSTGPMVRLRRGGRTLCHHCLPSEQLVCLALPSPFGGLCVGGRGCRALPRLRACAARIPPIRDGPWQRRL